MKKNIVYIIVSLLVLGVLVYVYLDQDKVEKTIFALNTKYMNTSFELMDKQEEQFFTIKTEGMPLADSLAALLPESVCVLRIHNRGCLSCYAQNFDYLYRLIREKNLRFFVLGTYSTRRQFKGELAGLIPLDSVAHANLDIYGFLPADSIEKPYLFVKGTGSNVEHVYIFNKQESETLGLYLESLKRIENTKHK